jgi:hypothetical protein
MTKKHPKHAIICGSTIDIFYVDSVVADDGTPCNGLSDSDNGWIKIDKNIPEGMLQDTFLHEMLHILICNSGAYQLFLNSKIKDVDDFSELLIRILTPHLKSLMKEALI